MLLLLLLFPLDCARRGDVRGGGRLVRGGKLVCLSEAVDLSEAVGLSFKEVGRLLGSGGQDIAVKAGSRPLPSRRVLGRTIKAIQDRAIKASAVKAISGSVRDRAGSLQEFMVPGCRYVAGRLDLFALFLVSRSGLDSLHALQAGQICVRSYLAGR